MKAGLHGQADFSAASSLGLLTMVFHRSQVKSDIVAEARKVPVWFMVMVPCRHQLILDPMHVLLSFSASRFAWTFISFTPLRLKIRWPLPAPSSLSQTQPPWGAALAAGFIRHSIVVWDLIILAVLWVLTRPTWPAWGPWPDSWFWGPDSIDLAGLGTGLLAWSIWLAGEGGVQAPWPDSAQKFGFQKCADDEDFRKTK